MGSSRWKRFAFFERNNLALPEAVVRDILPTGNSDPIADEIGLAVVNGAGIPIASIPDHVPEDGSGVGGMLQTVLCTGKETSLSKENNYDNLNAFQFSASGKTVSLPSNMRSGKGNVDGSLVLAFVSSMASQRVHCIDLTVRSMPLHKSKKSIETGSSRDDLGGEQEQDLDGWRGYFCPFVHMSGDFIPGPGPSNQLNTSNSTSWNIPKVTSVAVCSDHGTDDITIGRNIYVACISNDTDSIGVTVHRNPHLYLNDLATLDKNKKVPESSGRVTPKVECFQPLEKFDQTRHGKPTCVDIKTNIVAVGTDIGKVLIYNYNTSTSASAQGGSVGTNKLTLLMEISNPHALKSDTDGAARLEPNQNAEEPHEVFTNVKFAVSAVKLVYDMKETDIQKMTGSKLFVTYYQVGIHNTTPMNSSSGVCCYDLGVLNPSSNNNGKMVPSARYDLDGRHLSTSNLCDIIRSRKGHDHHCDKFMVARTDGLYTYSTTDKLSVTPIDGLKISLCSIPPSPVSRRYYQSRNNLYHDAVHENDKEKESNNMDKGMVDHAPDSGGSYVLVATTDSKSGRDAIDIYDTNNKLVAFHLLLSPGHRALRSAGVTTTPKVVINNNVRGGLSLAIVLTSGGSIVTCAEKVTSEKVGLLVQKNLYSAAISVAFADPSYQPSDISSLFRRHAEHLYRKGDYSAAMDQYIHTIGSLESSHVIFRYLDAPKIGLLTKYLEELKSRGVASSVHFELLKTCYLKLNDSHMADKISASISKTMDSASCNSLISNLLGNPIEALATICSFEAQQAAEALKTYGTVLAKALPKETAGIVISLCDGVYSSSSVAEFGQNRQSLTLLEKSLETSNQEITCDMYPVSDFSSAFLEHPKILRVILAHCHKFKRSMDNAHKRMLLKLTLEDWNAAKRSGDFERENHRLESARALLSDVRLLSDIGDYEALVIVEEQNFDEGIIMMYEKLQMTHLLLEKYAEDGSYKARRKMLAMCRSDPELLSDVLGFFIKKAIKEIPVSFDDESVSSDCTIGELLDDIKEGLSLARSQKVLPHVRVARILAGNGTGQFQEENRGNPLDSNEQNSVPLSVALEYIGDILDESTIVINKLKSDVEDYSHLCESMEAEISELLAYQKEGTITNHLGIDIEHMYSKLLHTPSDITSEKKSELIAESFWREINQSSDRFDTIARFYAKDVLD